MMEHGNQVEVFTLATSDVLGKNEDDGFDVRRYFQKLECKLYGTTLVYAHTMSSTQTYMMEQGTGFPEGAVCVADYQTSGKGRGSNVWESPKGCLLFTLKSSVKEGSTLPMVQYIVSLAVVKGIKRIPGLAEAPVHIKWPNDIYFDRKVKIGGILCQSTFRDGAYQICIGVGLNVNNKSPTLCLDQIRGTKGFDEKIAREDVLGEILSQYERLHLEFLRSGFSVGMKTEYEQNWLHTGQQVRIEQNDGFDATIQGLSTTTGALLAKRNDSGERVELYPDGNRMDFFQGLVSRKL